MARIIINGNGIITVGGKQYCNKTEYSSSFNDVLNFVFAPFEPQGKCLAAYAVSVEICENTVASLSGGAKAFIYDSDCIEIELVPPEYIQHHAPVTLEQKTVNKGGEHLITVYNDGLAHILVEGCFGMLVNTLPCGLSNVSLKCDSTRGGGIVLLTAKCGNADYALVLLIDNDYRMLGEYTADAIEITAEGLKLVTRYHDMLEHTKEELINPVANPTCINKSFLTNWSALNYPHELLPYIFLEALQIGAEDECMSYLTGDLKSSFDSVSSYFGSFDRIIPPKYAEYNLNRVSLVPTGSNINKIRYFDFTISGAEINNIEEISCNFIK